MQAIWYSLFGRDGVIVVIANENERVASTELWSLKNNQHLDVKLRKNRPRVHLPSLCSRDTTDKSVVATMVPPTQKKHLKLRMSQAYSPTNASSSPREQISANEEALLCQEELISSPETSPTRDTTNAPSATAKRKDDSSRTSSAATSSVMAYSLSTELSEASSKLIFSTVGLRSNRLAHSRHRTFKRQKSDGDMPDDEPLSGPLFPEIKTREDLPLPENVSPTMALHLRPVTPEHLKSIRQEQPKSILTLSSSTKPSPRTSTVTPAELDKPVETESKKRKNRSPPSRSSRKQNDIAPQPNQANFHDILESATRMFRSSNLGATGTIAVPSLPTSSGIPLNTSNAHIQPLQLPPQVPSAPEATSQAIWLPTSQYQQIAFPPAQQYNPNPPHLQLRPTNAMPMLPQRQTSGVQIKIPTKTMAEQPHRQASELQLKLPMNTLPQQPKRQTSGVQLDPRPQKYQNDDRLFDDVFRDSGPQDDAALDLMDTKELEPDTSVYMCSRDSNNEDIPTEISTETLQHLDDDNSRQLPWFPVPPPPERALSSSKSSGALYFGDRGPPLANNNNRLQLQQRQSPRRHSDEGLPTRQAFLGTKTRAPLIDDDESDDEIDLNMEKFFEQFHESNQEAAVAQEDVAEPDSPLTMLARDTSLGSSLITFPEQEQGVRMARTESIQGDEDIGGLLSHVLLPSPTKHGGEPLQYSSSI